MAFLGEETFSSYIQSDDYKNCPHCNGIVVYWKHVTYNYLFHFRVSKVSQNSYFECTSCKKRLDGVDIIPTPEITDTYKREDGSFVIKSKQVGIGVNTIFTQIDRTKAFPKVNAPEEFATTITAILSTLYRIVDKEESVETSEWYEHLFENFSDYQEAIEKINYLCQIVPLEEAKVICYNKFDQCNKLLRGTEMFYILKYTLRGLTNNEKTLEIVNDFYFQLFNVLKIENSQKQSTFQSLLKY